MNRREQLEQAVDSLGLAINRTRDRLEREMQHCAPEDVVDVTGQPILASLYAALVTGLAALESTR